MNINSGVDALVSSVAGYAIFSCQIKVLGWDRACDAFVVWKVRFLLRTQLDINALAPQILDLPLQFCHSFVASLNVELHEFWVGQRQWIHILASLFLQIKNRGSTWIACYTHFINAEKRRVSRTEFRCAGTVDVSEIVHFFHIVFCVIINLQIPNHFLSVGKHCVIVALTVFKELIRITSFTAQSFYVKIRGLCVITRDTSIKSCKRFRSCTFDGSKPWFCCTIIFYFSSVIHFKVVCFLDFGVCEICEVRFFQALFRYRIIGLALCATFTSLCFKVKIYFWTWTVKTVVSVVCERSGCGTFDGG